MIRLAIHAHGRPAPQGSHEIGANGHIMHSSNYLAAWRRQVAIATLTAVKAAGYGPGGLPLFGPGVPVHVHELTLLVQDDQCRAAGSDEPTGRPDVDKLLRATIDGMGDAHLFADDAQIVKIHELGKARPARDELTGAIIIISDTPRPPAGCEHEQGESMTTTEYRISLERVTRDADGERVYETTFELFGTAGQVGSIGLTTVGALLGAGTVSIDAAEPSDTTPEPAVADDKPKRGRPRKATAAPAEPVATAPEAVALANVPDPAPQAVDEPVAAPVTVPVAPTGRVNPFAQS